MMNIDTSAGAIKGVIFDLDGTLMSTSLNFADIRKAIDCDPTVDVLTHLDSLAPFYRQKAQRQIEQFEWQDAQHSVPLPGAAQCIAFLQQRALYKAVVTRNSSVATHHKLSRTEWQFDTVLSRDDAAHKPSPEGLLHIADRWQLAPTQLIYIGDYLYDVMAANNAGMWSCLYAPGALPDYAVQADLVVRDFASFIDYLQQVT